jgi:hypothetical protein
MEKTLDGMIRLVEDTLTDDSHVYNVQCVLSEHRTVSIGCVSLTQAVKVFNTLKEVGFIELD